ncbi:MAG: hypothetical protein H7Y42_06915 [Chitinophagaceae bacterium]|nr:hypothetical protein [Chitinophagaceae bacterium]
MLKQIDHTVLKELPGDGMRMDAQSPSSRDAFSSRYRRIGMINCINEDKFIRLGVQT